MPKYDWQAIETKSKKLPEFRRSLQLAMAYRRGLFGQMMWSATPWKWADCNVTLPFQLE